jgi:hypothetical protein
MTMSYPQQPGGWSDPSSGPSYVDPVTGQPAYPTSPPAQPGYPTSPGPYATGQGGYPPPQPQPGYAPGYPGYPAPVMMPAQHTNGMAIASLVLSLCGLGCGVAGLVGAILGHVARRQIRERGEGGDGMALAGIIVGWIVFGLTIVIIAAYVIFAVWLYNNPDRIPSTYPS